jgi:3-hydroxy-9,10-secoandrosta-1,3,5(10)-triene-9,17-dione monooxygenase reductase component
MPEATPQPDAPPPAIQHDPRSLRNVLGCYATGVAILTTITAEKQPIGVTVNSFSSVSLDPPLILFSLLNTAGILPHFQQAEHFNVNILSSKQEALSNIFARPSSATWDTLPYENNPEGCALFSGCVAQLECRRYAEIDGGDHRIFLGTVLRFHLLSPAEPLLFYRGRYGTYVRDQWAKTPPADSELTELSIPGWG